MPGLLNQDHELPNSISHELHQETNNTSAPLAKPVNPISLPAMANAVRFIPPQMDALASTTTEAARKNPFRLLIQDLGTLVSKLPYLPRIILPLKASDRSAELYGSVRGTRDIVLQSWLFLFEACILALAIPALFFLPGFVFIGLATFCSIAVFVGAWPMHGSRLTYSNMDDNTIARAKQHESERWIFVNGCTTSHAGMQKNIDRLSQTFGRAVIGVHNKSYGLIADLAECLLQRCFDYSTADVRATYDYVKACLADPTVTKVILIGHGQGGIIISLVLDYLFADLPASSIAKLEIYTFGSAASHFNNPRVSLSHRSARYVPHIEHYCNEDDMMARWGVLHNTISVLDNRYSGAVFVREGATGHLFNQHYLHALFPIIGDTVAHQVGESSFWDAFVLVDEKTAVRRESAAIKNMGVLRESGSLEALANGVPKLANGGGRAGVGAQGEYHGIVMENAALIAKARGKKVRELSRLWMYQGGGEPVHVEG